MANFKFNTKFGFSSPIRWKEQGEQLIVRSFLDLTKPVYQIRNREGGDLRPAWQDRLASEFCTKHPILGCREGDITVRKITLSDVAQFLRSMQKWKRLGGKFVPPALAEKRAAICAECPENVPIVGCFGCANALPKILEMVKKVSTSKDAELDGCGVCGCALKAKVHFPVDVMNNRDAKDFPDTGCWVRDEMGG